MNMSARAAMAAIAVMLGLLDAAAAPPATTIAVIKAWARATPPKADVGVVYMTITNQGTTADRLESLSSPVAGSAMAHQTTMKNGVMAMTAISGGLVIPPHASVVLKPFHKHIMLEGLKTPLQAGSSFPLNMTFRHAGKIVVTVSVTGMGAMQAPAAGAGK
ncbi:MAG: copper chaperone PCu(A)C [Hyphomicrobiales bacterium]|nr:copper chaperone PCu(A)C [Hyphomicrobiales bacterium]